MLPLEEPDSSSNSGISSNSFIEISSSSSSSSRSTSLPTTITSTSAAATAEPSSGMFAVVLAQLRAELAEERRKREALEARQRELALHLYYVVDEQIRGVKAMRKLVQNARECKEDNVKEMVAVVKRMKGVWEKKRPRSFKRMRCSAMKSD